MAICSWCEGEMTSVLSCTIDAFHQSGRSVRMIPFGREPGWPDVPERCGDCGVQRGGWHHPGCDLQCCPVCCGQMMSCDCRFDEDGAGDFDEDGASDLYDGEPLGVDGNGVPTERVWLGDVEVIVHHEDVPASDITSVDGIRVTTPVRTLIDIAPDTNPTDLATMVRDALHRNLFTLDEAWHRLGQADMAQRRGAELLRRVLPPRDRAADQ